MTIKAGSDRLKSRPCDIVLHPVALGVQPSAASIDTDQSNRRIRRGDLLVLTPIGGAGHGEGIGFLLGENATIDVRYHDTDEHSYGKIYDSRVAVSLKAAF